MIELNPDEQEAADYIFGWPVWRNRRSLLVWLLDILRFCVGCSLVGSHG